MDAVEGEEVEVEVEVEKVVEKVEVEKVKKTRKPLGEEALQRLAKAREKANLKRKELSEERKAEKENLVKQKMEEVQIARKQKDDTAAVKEARKRVRAKRESIIIERESSGSSSEDDITDARVYTVRKRSNTEAEPPPEKQPVEDPFAGMYSQFFLGTRSIF